MSSDTSKIQIKDINNEINTNIKIELLESTYISEIVPHEILSGNMVNNIIVSADLVRAHQQGQIEKKVESVSLSGNEVIFVTVKDIIFNLILNNKSLRSKLNQLLETPNKAIEDISMIFNEISEKMTAQDVDSLRKFVCLENTRTSIGSILTNSFTDIMADGKIDLNDTNHFLTLIYNIVNLFNSHTENTEFQITLSADVILFFLYFIIKCTLVLTLDGEEETTALGLLDTTFKLVRISVLPISFKKCSCNLFACFSKK
jgi:hypothetical protein